MRSLICARFQPDWGKPNVRLIGGREETGASRLCRAARGASRLPDQPAFPRRVSTSSITEFVRPRRLHVHIVEGPFPVDGTWSFEPDDSGTRVHFVADGQLRGVMRLLEPIVTRIRARQFAGYHRNLRRIVESG